MIRQNGEFDYFRVGMRVQLIDQTWIHGTVIEVGYAAIKIKWDDEQIGTATHLSVRPSL